MESIPSTSVWVSVTSNWLLQVGIVSSTVHAKVFPVKLGAAICGKEVCKVVLSSVSERPLVPESHLPVLFDGCPLEAFVSTAASMSCMLMARLLKKVITLAMKIFLSDWLTMARCSLLDIVQHNYKLMDLPASFHSLYSIHASEASFWALISFWIWMQ